MATEPFRRGQNLFSGFGPQCASVADFTGSGKLDLAIVNSSSPQVVADVEIFLGQGDGTFSAGQRIPVQIAPWATAVDDFNGDHIPDLVVANTLPASFSLLIGRGNGTFVNAGTFGM